MRRKGKLYVILSLILVVGLMIVGYATYNQHLSISETSKIDSNFNILITNIETKEVGGEALNESEPTYNGLEANFNITFNKKNDYIEYNVEVSNKGSIEAYLNQIKIENENSKVVNMSYRDINIGEELLVGESKTFVVRIEYKGGSGSGEITLNLDYSADNSPGEIIVPEENYKVIYNTEENGGEKGEIEEKYYKKGEEIDLRNVGKKEGYTFVGWNINKDAKEVIKTLQMGEEEITLYAIYKKEIESKYKIGDGIKEIPIEKETCEIYNKEETCKINLPNIESIKAQEGRVIDGWYKDNTKVENNTQIIRENSIYEIKAYPDIPANIEINTSTLSNSIRVVTNVINIEEVKGIERYEYSIDNSEYIESNNTYTFDNLEHNTEHTIKVRVTTKGNIQTEKEITVRTLEIATPTFSEEIEGVVKITYPRECEDRYTCTYIKDNGEETQITKNPEEVIFGASGTIIAKVTDGTNYITSSTYTVERTNLYVSNNGNDESGYGTKESPYKTINKAYDSSSLTNESTIYVMDDITQTETALFDENKTITLTSYSEDDTVNSIIRGDELTDNLLTLENGNLSLNTITIDGNNVEAQAALVLVNGENVELNSTSNVVIKNGNNKYLYSSTTNPKQLGGGICGTAGTINLNNNTISNNQADYGGGIYANYAELNIINTNVTNNSSISNGGGITSNTKMTINSSDVSHNSTSGNGAGIHINGTANITTTTINYNESEGAGAGFYASNATVFINETTKINNNITSYSGAGIFLNKSNCTINNVLIDSNSTIGPYAGGGITIHNESNLTLKNGTISNNNGGESSGAGVRNTGGTFIMEGGNIIKNVTTRYGGGISCSGEVTTCIINGGEIKENTAHQGGGIYTENSDITLKSVLVSNNKAKFRGGGIYSNGGTFTMNSGTISNNAITGSSAAGYDGGGILFMNSNSKITGGSINGNTALHMGGGIGMYGGELTMSGGEIISNSGQGINIYDSAKFILTGGTINNNTVNSLIANYAPNIGMGDSTSTFVDNTASYTSNIQKNYFVATASNNNFVLDVTSAAVANGTNIQLYTKNSSNAQKWRIYPYKVVNGVTDYIIQSQIDRTQYVWVNGNSSTSGANVITYSLHGNAGGYWRLTNQDSGYYQIKNINGLCLDLVNGTAANGTNIRAYTCNNATAQKWKFVETT